MEAYSPEFQEAFYAWQKVRAQKELDEMLKGIKETFAQRGLYTTGAMLLPEQKAREAYQTTMADVGYRGALQKALAEREERMAKEVRAWQAGETEKERKFRLLLAKMEMAEAKRARRRGLLGRILGGLARGAGYFLAPATGGLSIPIGEGLGGLGGGGGGGLGGYGTYNPLSLYGESSAPSYLPELEGGEFGEWLWRQGG